MNIKAFVMPFAASAGALLLSFSGGSEAQAYSVGYNGRTAGNPPGQKLIDIGLDSRFDQNRQLDAADFSLGAGTANTDGDVLSSNILGNAVMTVLNLQQDLLSLEFKVANNTASDFQSSIVSLWFGVAESLTGANLNDGTTFDDLRVTPQGANAPGGFKNIDICVYAANGCNGGNINQGLLSQEKDTFTVNIAGNFGVYDTNDVYLGYNSATIRDLGAKWQTSDGSYEVAGVPEPITVLGSGAALAFGMFMKRRSSNQGIQKNESVS